VRSANFLPRQIITCRERFQVFTLCLVRGLEFTISRGIITATCNFTQRMHRLALWRLSLVESGGENPREPPCASCPPLPPLEQRARAVNASQIICFAYRLCRWVCMRRELHPISCLGALKCCDNKNGKYIDDSMSAGNFSDILLFILFPLTYLDVHI
jgi:hypothetical protein